MTRNDFTFMALIQSKIEPHASILLSKATFEWIEVFYNRERFHSARAHLHCPGARLCPASCGASRSSFARPACRNMPNAQNFSTWCGWCFAHSRAPGRCAGAPTAHSVTNPLWTLKLNSTKPCLMHHPNAVHQIEAGAHAKPQEKGNSAKARNRPLYAHHRSHHHRPAGPDGSGQSFRLHLGRQSNDR